MSLTKKLLFALTAYAVLALLAWQTLSEPKYRALVCVLLGFFAFKSLLFWYKETHPVETGDTRRK
jgi:apolipoprotein N-acyltransferase